MDTETVMRCFMAAYDRYHEHVEDGTMYFESTAPDDNDRSLYSKLKQNGTEPIDPEALGIMTIKVIKDFVSKVPRLAPK